MSNSSPNVKYDSHNYFFFLSRHVNNLYTRPKAVSITNTAETSFGNAWVGARNFLYERMAVDRYPFYISDWIRQLWQEEWCTPSIGQPANPHRNMTWAETPDFTRLTYCNGHLSYHHRIAATHAYTGDPCVGRKLKQTWPPPLLRTFRNSILIPLQFGSYRKSSWHSEIIAFANLPILLGRPFPFDIVTVRTLVGYCLVPMALCIIVLRNEIKLVGECFEWWSMFLLAIGNSCLYWW